MLAREGGGGVDDTSGIGDLGGLVFFKKESLIRILPVFKYSNIILFLRKIFNYQIRKIRLY